MKIADLSDKDLKKILERCNITFSQEMQDPYTVFILSECVERLMEDRIFKDEQDNY